MLDRIIISLLSMLAILLLSPFTLGFMIMIFISIFGSWLYPDLITTTSGLITALWTVLFSLTFSLQLKLFQIVEKQNVNIF